MAVPVPLPAWYDCVSALICRLAAPNVVSPEPAVPEWETSDASVSELLIVIVPDADSVSALPATLAPALSVSDPLSD